MKKLINYFKDVTVEKAQLWVIIGIFSITTLVYLIFEVWTK